MVQSPITKHEASDSDDKHQADKDEKTIKDAILRMMMEMVMVTKRIEKEDEYDGPSLQKNEEVTTESYFHVCWWSFEREDLISKQTSYSL